MNFKKRIPWRLKIISKIVLSRLPVGFKFWQKLGLFKLGLMATPAYARKIFVQHIERGGLHNNLTDKVVLELGPGDSLATIVLAYAYGARAILVDVGEFAINDLGFYKGLVKKLKDEGLRVPDLNNVTTLKEIVELCDGEYLTSGLASLMTVSDSSVDFVFSHAVLEHISKHEFDTTFSEIRRIIKDHGGTSHNVDLKDHLSGGLNNKRFSSNLWESSFFTNSGFYTNRLSCVEMLAVFRENRFECEEFDSKSWDSLPLPKHKMATEFQSYSEEELSVKEFNVLLKPVK